MSFAHMDEAKERIRESVEITDLVGSYMSLRRQGPNLVGLCPWHNDSKPSFNVSPSRQTWRCWVCNVGGDIFSFVMRYEGVEFNEALGMLADRAGIELPKASGRGPGTSGVSNAPADRDKKRSLLKILDWAEKRFHDALLNSADGAVAREYLQERGITSESIQQYKIGFSPESWSWLYDLARERHIEEKSLLDVGLIGRSEHGKCYDRFRGRVIFPIHDLQGRAIAFGGRILPHNAEDGAKYVNSPETQFFKKRTQLYGLDVVHKDVVTSRAVTVMEGYTDVVMARQLGVLDPVAVLGTALGEGHIKLLKRFVDKVTLVLDGDEAGQKRTNELLNMFISQQMDLRVLTLPDGLDPCDYIAQRGTEAFDALRAQAPDALEQKIQNELRGIDPMRDTHRGHLALENVLEALALVPGTNDKQRSKELLILARLYRTFGVEVEELRKRLTALRGRTRTKRWVEEEPEVAPKAIEVVPESVRELMEILLLAPELAQIVVSEVTSEQFGHSGCEMLFGVIAKFVAGGRVPSFENLMAELQTVEQQSVLVEIDEHARQKAESTAVTPVERWQMWREARLYAKYRVDAAEKRRLLRSSHMNKSEAIDVLESLLASRRAYTKKPDPEEWS